MSSVRRSSRLAASAATGKSTAVQTPAVDLAPVEEKPTDSDPSTLELEVGDKIPALSIPDQDGNQINLHDVAEKHPYVVIFAYPKASTPGCTRQLCGFQKDYPFYTDNKVAVFGLSADSPKQQGTFAAKHKALFPLLSDPNYVLIKPLGAAKPKGGIKRSHWIFVNGVLTVKNVQVSPETSVATAREAIQEFIDKDSNKLE